MYEGRCISNLEYLIDCCYDRIEEEKAKKYENLPVRWLLQIKIGLILIGQHVFQHSIIWVKNIFSVGNLNITPAPQQADLVFNKLCSWLEENKDQRHKREFRQSLTVLFNELQRNEQYKLEQGK
jgi:hypothetical protein